MGLVKKMKIAIVVLGALFFSQNTLIPEVQAKPGANWLKNGGEIMQAQDAQFTTLYGTVFGDDIETCFQYSQILLWNSVDAIRYIIQLDPFLSVFTVGLIIHKSPIVFWECSLVIKDLEYIDAIFTEFNKGPFQFNINEQIIDNLMFNLGDILYNLIIANGAMGKRDYYQFGETVGSIISDIFYINPTDFDVWSDINSNVITSASSSLKVPSSFYQELKVESAEPTLHQTFNSLSNKLGSMVKSQEDKVNRKNVSQQRKTRDEFMKVQPLLKEGEQHRPFYDRLMELSPVYKYRDEMKNARNQELQEIADLDRALEEL